MKRYAIFGTLVLLAIGCSGDNHPVGVPKENPSGAMYLLSEAPAGVKGVIDARKDAKDGDEVVVKGRIGGNKNPWIEGRAGFWIVDSSFKPCNEREDDACDTPWDYCCDSREDLLRGMATVKVLDRQGRTVEVDARKLLGVKELQTVIVRGKAKRDQEGNLTILASGVYCAAGDKK
jgi:hypothetical protein